MLSKLTHNIERAYRIGKLNAGDCIAVHFLVMAEPARS